MSSWHYAFFFPASNQKLHPKLGLEVLSECNLEFDHTIHMAKCVDNAGHLAGVGEEKTLREPILKTLGEILLEGQQFLIECRNTELFISCEFFHQSNNSHISFGWSRGLFAELSENNQQRYWEMLLDFAKKINAGYVILIDDAPDFFIDRFLEIDGKRFLDTHVNHSYGHGINGVWVNKSIGALCPEGVLNSITADLGEGFVQYCVD